MLVLSIGELKHSVNKTLEAFEEVLHVYKSGLNMPSCVIKGKTVLNVILLYHSWIIFIIHCFTVPNILTHAEFLASRIKTQFSCTSHKSLQTLFMIFVQLKDAFGVSVVWKWNTSEYFYKLFFLKTITVVECECTFQETVKVAQNMMRVNFNVKYITQQHLQADVQTVIKRNHVTQSVFKR